MLEGLVIELLQTVLYLVIITLVTVTIGWIKQKWGVEGLRKFDEELRAKQDLALIAVRFAEQAYTEFDGPGKYNKAAEYLSSRLDEKNINVSEDEIKGLIESALRFTKDFFGNGWGRVLKQDE